MDFNEILTPIELEENQQIADAVLIARVVDFDSGTSSIFMINSPGMHWVLQRGMLSAAQHIADCQSFFDDEDEDD
jgi:hypothetical protein